MTRVDPDTAEAIRRILIVSRNKGADPVMALDMAGLLRYPAKIKQDWVDALDAMALSIEATPATLIRREELPKTPMDMKNTLLSILRKLRERIIHGPEK